MDRRRFIKNSSLASGALLVPGFLRPLQAMANNIFSSDKKLVVIQLSGGNDGLNTVVPYRNDIYYKARPGIALKKDMILPFDDEHGLHSALAPLRSMYDDGTLSIVNGVGYPNPDRSHFRSLDIWHSASASDEYLSTGWLGRFLDNNCQKAHEAVEVHTSLSLAMKGDRMKGIAVADPRQMYLVTREPLFEELAQNGAQENEQSNLAYLFKTMVNSYSSAEHLYKSSKAYASEISYPKTDIGKQLRTTAKLLIGGAETKVYYVSLSGFDTHVNQGGKQNRVLEQYAQALDVFVKDLKANDRFNDTLIMTFSEFGRRVKQNAGQGTDHGTANNLFLIGGNLKKLGMYNELPSLSDLDDNGDLKFSIDFRDVYADVLKNWLRADDERILNRKVTDLGLF